MSSPCPRLSLIRVSVLQSGLTLLHMAALSGITWLAADLIAKGADVNPAIEVSPSAAFPAPDLGSGMSALQQPQPAQLTAMRGGILRGVGRRTLPRRLCSWLFREGTSTASGCCSLTALL